MTKPDGGPAFPNPALADEDFQFLADMTGLTARDWFAGQALSGMLAFDGYVKPISETRPTSEVFAHSAYEIADAMLAERYTE